MENQHWVVRYILFSDDFKISFQLDSCSVIIHSPW